MSKAMSLKAKIRNIAKHKNIPAQVILQNYMFERLLVRLSMSEYKEKFVLKGGMLVAAIVRTVWGKNSLGTGQFLFKNCCHYF